MISAHNDICNICGMRSVVSREDENEQLHSECTNPNCDLNTGPVLDYEPQPYDGFEGQWPGDGSGLDDLADFNQMEAMDYIDE